MSRILLLMSDIDGAGATRITIELYDYLSKDNEVVCYAMGDKKVGRKTAQPFDKANEHMFKDGPVSFDKEFDKVIITTIPGKSYPDEAKDNFLKTLEALNKDTKIIFLQICHKIHGINRQFIAEDLYMERFFALIDLVITPTDDTDFITKFMPRVENKDHIKFKSTIMISTDFDSFTWQDFENKYQKTITYIGRSPGWKGWLKLIDLHYKLLKEAGYTTRIEGIENSIGAMSALHIQLKPVKIPIKGIDLHLKDDPNDFMELPNNDAIILPPYNRIEALERMSRSMFGGFFTFLGEKYGGVIEITFLEIIASGTIPIVRKKLYDSAKLTKDDRMSNYTPQEMGIVIYDEDDPKDIVHLLNVISTNKELYERFRTNGLKFFKDRFDQNNIMKVITRMFDED